ncbi:MAG: sugar nucleotide-binding protein [Candidatus Rokubacteria bacterium]|nr:sugar nucleotide-binding protein [Candidatus Rokubacteria bacterium]
MTAAPAAVLLTGGSGRLGTALRAADPTFVAPPRRELDVTDPGAVHAALARHRPATVIHAAALRGSRECEAAPADCLAINVGGTLTLARACLARGVRLVYVSTDYVFDGRRGHYAEGDAVNPVNLYARSKLAGELIVRTLADSLVVRTAFYRADGWKFPTAFVDQFSSQQPVEAVARDLVRAATSPLTGVLHIGGPRRSSYEVAREVDPAVRPIRLAEAGLALPADVSLDSSRWRAYLAGADELMR